MSLALLLCSTGMAQTFTSSGTITVSPTVGGASTGYPTSPFASCANGGCLNVSGLTGSVNTVTITLNNFNVTNSNSVAFMLEAPDGTDFDFLSATCNIATGISFTLSDAGAAPIPVSGCAVTNNTTWKPANYVGAGQDLFPSPAVTSPNTAGDSAAGGGSPAGTATFGSQFAGKSGTAVNGVWRLYVATEVDPPTAGGTLGSWTLTFTTNAGAATTTSIALQSGSNPSFTASPGNSVTFRATVLSTSTVNGGTVSFTDNGSPLTCQAGSSAAVSGGTFDCVAFFTTEGDHSIIGKYNGAGSFAASGNSNTLTQGAVNHTHQTGNTYCNDHTALTIPLTTNASSPYPSEIFIGSPDVTTAPTGGGLIEKITVNLKTLTYGTAFFGMESGLGFMLVGPNGKAYSMVSFVGDNTSVSSLSFTLDDTAAQTLQTGSGNNPVNGNTYRPADYQSTYGANPDQYVAPAPFPFDAAAPTGTATFLTEYAGSGATGTWKLFVDNRGISTASGSLGSWCINFTMTAGAATTVTVASSQNPALTNTSPVLTATVHSTSTVNEGMVTFTEGVTNLGSVSVINNTAQLTLTAGSIAEGTHTISASYGGTTNFGPSTGNIIQRLDNPTTAYLTSTSHYAYCNAGTISIPATGTQPNPSGPYPSNVFVTAMPGTVNNATISLNHFSFNEPVHLESLLVGPTGNNGHDIVFFSDAGGTGDPINVNLLFDDVLGATFPATLSVGGTFKTIATSSAITFPGCPPNAPVCGPLGPPAPTSGYHFAHTAGTTTLNGQYANINGDGTWSLYMQNTLLGADGTIVGDSTAPPNTAGRNPFCVNFLINPPVLAIAKTHSGSFTQGDVGRTYAVTVTNNGPGSTGDPSGTDPVTVTESAPAGLTVTAISGTNWICNVTGGGTGGTCHRSDGIAATNSYETITVTVSVAANATTGTNALTNHVSVVGGGAATASTTDPTTIIPAPVLAVSKAASGTFQQGATGTWLITVSNTAVGSTAAGTLTVTDTLTAGYTLQSFSGSNWSCTGTGTANVSCTDTETVLGGNAYQQLSLVVNIPANAAATVSNTATASGAGSLVSASGSATGVSVTQLPDLSIAKSHVGSFSQGHQNTFTLSVSNAGSATTGTNTMTVTDTLASGFAFVSGSGGGFSCTNSLQVVTCTSTTAITAGNHADITLTVNTAANATSPLTNQASVACACSESNSGNNASNVDSVVVTQLPDLTISKTHTPATFIVGDSGDQINITVANSGSASSSGTITVTDTLPTGLTFVSSPTANWSCSAALQVVTCTSTLVIASPGNTSLSLLVNVASSTSTPLTNNVSVACTCSESSTTNNSNTDSITVTQQVGVTLDTSPTGLQISGDGGTTFFTAPHLFQFAPGTQHTIATTSPQSLVAGTQYVWTSWSDGMAISHQITAPATPTTFTATFKTQYLLTTQVSPNATEGSISPASGFVDAGSSVPVTATANTGYTFTGFSGGLTGTTNPQNITVNAAATVTANFGPGATSLGGTLTGKTGPTNARVWSFTFINNGPGVALGTQINSFTLTQTGGAGCTPVVTAPAAFPFVIGDIAPSASQSANVTIDFTTCVATARFTLTMPISANNGAVTGTLLRNNEFR